MAEPTQKPRSNSKRPRRLPSTACSACGVEWVDHLGISGTCKKLEDARSALRVIYTWASFQNGRALNCEDVIRLITTVLKDIEPNATAQATRPENDHGN